MAAPATVEAAVNEPAPGTPGVEQVSPGPRRPRVVIIGGGFAGLEAAKVLGNKPVDVTVIDRTNHHLFQPLLYQVATAALAPSDIASPIRHILRRYKNIEVILGEVNKIDVEAREVQIDNGQVVFSYDYLVLGTGARHSYFGNDQWEKHAPGLKNLGDALEIRQRFLLAFEEAEKTDDPVKRREFMTFAIIGAGPTGCELAGVFPEIARHALRPDFHNIDTTDVLVILLEGGKRILPQFPEALAAQAQKDLERLGVDIRVGAKVVNIEPGQVFLEGGERIAARTIVWAAGNAASPLARQLGAPLDRAGRVQVEKDLSVPGHPEVFVAGDLAATFYDGDKPVPGVAQGAIQGGHVAGKNILHRLYRENTEAFNYWNKGDMAVIGRNKAIAKIGKAQVSGFIAWAMWLFIHILYLVGFRNRLSVLLQWAFAYLTYQRGVRLITETDQRRLGQNADAPAPLGP